MKPASSSAASRWLLFLLAAVALSQLVVGTGTRIWLPLGVFIALLGLLGPVLVCLGVVFCFRHHGGPMISAKEAWLFVTAAMLSESLFLGHLLMMVMSA